MSRPRRSDAAGLSATLPPGTDRPAVVIEPPSGASGGVLPDRIAALLRWAQSEEKAAAGPARRVALRFTRELIGGVIDAGYPTALIADCLGVTTNAVRDRMQRDSWLAARKVERGAHLRAGTLRRWHDRGLLPDGQVGMDGDLTYPAMAVVRAIVSNAALRRKKASPAQSPVSAASTLRR